MAKNLEKAVKNIEKQSKISKPGKNKQKYRKTDKNVKKTLKNRQKFRKIVKKGKKPRETV